MTNTTVGARIQKLRENKAWSQKELARRVNVSGVTIGKYEDGTTEPKVTELSSIAQALGTTGAYLLGEIDDPSPAALVGVGALSQVKELRYKTVGEPSSGDYQQVKRELERIQREKLRIEQERLLDQRESELEKLLPPNESSPNKEAMD